MSYNHFLFLVSKEDFIQLRKKRVTQVYRMSNNSLFSPESVFSQSCQPSLDTDIDQEIKIKNKKNKNKEATNRLTKSNCTGS